MNILQNCICGICNKIQDYVAKVGQELSPTYICVHCAHEIKLRCQNFQRNLALFGKADDRNSWEIPTSWYRGY